MNAIGIDLGTTSLSAIVMEEGTGEVVETINSPNEAVMNDGSAWEKKQDPQQIFQAVRNILEELIARYAPIVPAGA